MRSADREYMRTDQTLKNLPELPKKKTSTVRRQKD